MSRMITVGIISAILGVFAGAVLILKFWTPPEPPPELAMIDLVGIVERQKVRVLKETVDPEEAERAIAKRMDRLAHLLSEIGQNRVILNKAAVVGGRLPDITERVEERLKESDGK